MFTLKVQKLFRKTLASWTLTPLRPKRPPSSRPRLEVLEDRVLLNNDILIWNPGEGDGTILASHAANWYDQTQGMQGVKQQVSATGMGARFGFRPPSPIPTSLGTKMLLSAVSFSREGAGQEDKEGTTTSRPSIRESLLQPTMA
jgi:hypothetical protein